MSVRYLLQWADASSSALQATLAAANVAARLRNKPVYNKPDILPFVEGPLEAMPEASPSIVNAEQLGLSMMS